LTTKRRRFLPYAFGERALPLEVTAVEFEGETVELFALFDQATRTLDLREFGGHAQPVAVRLETPALDPDLARTLVPKRELPDPPLRIVAVAMDAGGWYRTTGVLEPIGERYAGVLEIVPADSTGHIDIEALVVRREDAARGPRNEFATKAGMKVASSSPIRVLTREPATMPGGALDVRWEDFRTSAHPERKRGSGRTFYLETTLDPPVLWLNRANPDLVAVLESKATRGSKAMVRDLLNQAIAQPVWYALVHTASMAVTRDEDGAPTVPDGWQRGILARVAPRIHRGLGKESAYHRLLDDLIEVDDVDINRRAWLTERLVLAIQDELGLDKITQRALRELARS
jgi:hypothetical protein